MSQTAETRPLVPKPVPGVNGVKPYPAKWRSYWELTRLHRFPMGTDLVFWPCTWGLTMAAYKTGLGPQQVAIQSLAYFLGSVLLHSAACVINDICDREFDRQVERCKNRPIASGAVSVFGATVFLLAQVGVCLWMLAYTNRLAFIVGLVGLFPFHTLYPLMKRYTNWPQAWLGLAMNWGLLCAWIGVTGSMNWTFVPHLLIGSQAWCIVYDTIYAYQDRRDDLKAGVNSTAVLFGDKGKPILSAFASVFVASLIYAGIKNEQGLPFFAISVGGCIAHFIWQFITVDLDEPKSCGAKFCANGHMGWILWAGLLVDYYLKVVA